MRGARPRIGITSGYADLDVSAEGDGASVVPSITAASHVASAVVAAGGLPFVLPSQPELADAYAHHLDGVVLSGGVDVDPAQYGHAATATAVDVDERRDAFELALIRCLRATDKPVLGLCRGMEIMAVAAGGSLLSQLGGDDSAGGIGHWQSEPGDQVKHEVVLKAGSRIQDICESSSVWVNSLHHQGIADPGDLDVTGLAPDGLPEVLEATDRWSVGVQWHPEYLRRTQPATRRLFQAFVDQATSPRAAHPSQTGNLGDELCASRTEEIA